MSHIITVNLEFDTPAKEKFDVELPVYREHHMDHSTNYTKIAAGSDGVVREVTLGTWHHNSSIQVEIEQWKSPQYMRASIDWLFGRGEYQADPKKFEDLLQKAIDVLTAIKQPPN